MRLCDTSGFVPGRFSAGFRAESHKILTPHPDSSYPQVMGWSEIYQDMCFQPDKHEFAYRQDVKDAIVTLNLYIQGRARRYEVEDALDTLSGAGAPVSQFRAILDIEGVENEDQRNCIGRECIQKIERVLLA